jgi:uncharacterized protein (DUF433 family)
LFHWESQSLTREASPTGQRYIHHRERGSRVLLYRSAEACGYVREENKRGVVTLPFLCLGFATCVSHESEPADGDSLAAAAGDSGGLRSGAGVGGVRGESPAAQHALDRPDSMASSRITHNPAQCGGKACIRGMRIRVSDVLDLYAAGLSPDQILAELPDLEPDDLQAALSYAARELDHPVLVA